MIISKLTLYNFGIYKDLRSFTFTDEKPVVLIGALNGSGKTTFLEAILFALYGGGSQAFLESGYSTLGNYLRAHSNNESEDSKCFVELEFSLDTEGESSTFRIKRSWDASRPRIAPHIEVYKNGDLDTNLTNNWTMYVEDIIPSALSGFFFFDGEKIAELVDRNNEDQQMKSSIRALLGIDLIDSLRSDLRRLGSRIIKRANTTNSREMLDELANKKAELNDALFEIDRQIDQNFKDIENLKKEKEAQRAKYSASGGQVVNNIEELRDRQHVLRKEVSDIDDDLVHLASTGYPLFMLKGLIERAYDSAKAEYDSLVFKGAFGRIELLLKEFGRNNPDSEFSEISDYLRNSIADSQLDPVFNPSASMLGQAGYLLSSVFGELENRHSSFIRRKRDCQRKLESINSLVNTDVDVDLVKEIEAGIEAIDEQIEQLEFDIRFQQNNRPSVNGEFIRCQAEYRRAVSEYLSSQDMLEENGRATVYIEKSERVLEAYRTKLQQAKARKLSIDITRCFNSLARKRDLITRVCINPETLDFRYFGRNGKEIDQSILSAGERQLVVISTLWALSLNSKERLPVIIDTPLARLDTVHRTSLIKTYFPNASRQVIILSTDSEVTGKCYELLKPNIANEYTLVYDEGERSTLIIDGYMFKEHQ